MMRAGLPTAVAPGGTGFKHHRVGADTRAVADREATQHLDLAPTMTPRPSVGWRFAPFDSDVPPSVTPW